MTRDSDFKRLVRVRMTTTGEKYTAARAALLHQRKEVGMVPVTCEVRYRILTEEEQQSWEARKAELRLEAQGDEDIQALVIGTNTGRRQPLLLLSEVDGARKLTIFCGAVEASSVALALQGIEPGRPMTHDLLRDVVGAMGEAREVRVTELRDQTYFAELVVLDNAGQERIVSCRPSDGIALAVRASIPILVAEALFPDLAVAEEG